MYETSVFENKNITYISPIQYIFSFCCIQRGIIVKREISTEYLEKLLWILSNY